jgi:hypothetical protein
VQEEAAYLISRQEAETVCNKKRTGQDEAPQGQLPPPMPLLSQFHHFSIAYSKFESISGLNHSSGQCPCDLIVSGNALTDTLENVLY